MDVFGLVNRAHSVIFAPRTDDDFIDRVNYRYTVGLLVLFAVIIITKQSSNEVGKIDIIYHLLSYVNPNFYAFEGQYQVLDSSTVYESLLINFYIFFSFR